MLFATTTLVSFTIILGMLRYDRFSCLSQITEFHFFFSVAITAKIHHRRRPLGEPQFEIDGRVEFIRQGPLLAYDTQHVLQQWLLINLQCAKILVLPGRSQLFVLTGFVASDGSLALTRLFPWHKKDVNIAVATRKWKHHKC